MEALDKPRHGSRSGVGTSPESSQLRLEFFAQFVDLFAGALALLYGRRLQLLETLLKHGGIDAFGKT
jgi:hypothetical protein